MLAAVESVSGREVYNYCRDFDAGIWRHIGLLDAYEDRGFPVLVQGGCDDIKDAYGQRPIFPPV